MILLAKYTVVASLFPTLNLSMVLSLLSSSVKDLGAVWSVQIVAKVEVTSLHHRCINTTKMQTVLMSSSRRDRSETYPFFSALLRTPTAASCAIRMVPSALSFAEGHGLAT